jgi:hypothetical protein
MALLPDKFKASEHEPMQDFEPIPADEYTLQVIKSEMKDTKDKTGKYLNLQLQVIDHEKYSKRLIFVLLNLVNKNETAVEIAQRELRSLCDAVGITALEDSVELHGIPFKASVGIKQGNDGYPPKNVIKKYHKKGEVKKPSKKASPFD